MAIKANVSFTQKLGQPDFGSVGAGCSIEVELDSTLLSKDPAQLQEQPKYTQIGNSLPVLLAKAIGKHLGDLI